MFTSFSFCTLLVIVLYDSDSVTGRVQSVSTGSQKKEHQVTPIHSFKSLFLCLRRKPNQHCMTCLSVRLMHLCSSFLSSLLFFCPSCVPRRKRGCSAVDCVCHSYRVGSLMWKERKEERNEEIIGLKKYK